MRVALTATKKGMTAQQKDWFEKRLLELKPLALVHGGCVGGDDDGDIIAARLGIWRIVFPSDNPAMRIPYNKLRSRGPVSIGAELPPLERNPLIVAAADYLLACPRQSKEIIRSGTWTTVRHARRRYDAGQVEIIYP